MKKIILILFTLIFLYFTNGFSQIKNVGQPFMTNYIPQSYGAGIQSWCAIQDNSGIMYFTNNSGVLEYDGNTWRLIELPKGSSPRSLSINEQGQIYVSADNDFGYLTADSIGNTIFSSLINIIPEEHRNFGYAWNIICLKKDIYVQSYDKIFIIKSNNEVKIIESDTRIIGIAKVNGFVYAYTSEDGVYKIVNNVLVQVPTTENITNIYSVVKYDSDTMLIVTKFGDLYKTNNTAEKWDIDMSYFEDAIVYRAINITEDYFGIMTLDNGIFIINKKGELIQHLNKEKGLIDNTIYNACVDNENNLWLTAGTSIVKVELFSPYTIFNKLFGLEIQMCSFISTIGKEIYVGTGTNLFNFKLKEYYNPSKQENYSEIINIERQTWSIHLIDNNLFVCSNPGILKINSLVATTVNALEGNNTWQIIEVEKEKTYIATTRRGLFYMEYKNGSFVNIKKIEGININCRYSEFDINGYLWVTFDGEGIFKIKLNEKKDSILNKQLYSKEQGLNNYLNLILVKNDNKLLLSTEKNMYIYNEETDRFDVFEKVNKFFNKNDALTFLNSDGNSYIWVETNSKRITVLKQENGQYTADNTIAARIVGFNLFNNINTLNKHCLLIATGTGLIHYDNRIAYNKNKKFKTFIRKVEILRTDSLLFAGSYLNDSNQIVETQSKNDIIKIKFEDNSLRFTFSAIFYEESHKTRYQYILANFDENWSRVNTETKKEYTNIPPGKYIFKVKAYNIYDNESEIAEYVFIIHPPWYKTIYVYIAYFILFILFVLVIIKFSTHRLAVLNMKLEIKVKERTIELQLQNVELEQQKEEILTQSEELQSQKERLLTGTEELELMNKELEKLSIVVSETRSAVIITDKNGDFAWVNDAFVKMFGYTLETLINEISPNIISNKTDLKTKQQIERCFREKVSVEYELETKTRTGQVLWVHTTLTPIFDEIGEIRMLVAIDSDITEIKKAERKIRIQNQNIRGSIKYALTIQKSILPNSDDINLFFENFIIYKPKDIVSGDFYWMSNKKFSDKTISFDYDNDDKLINEKEVGSYSFFAVVDCTGHGVPGAFMSLIGSRLLSEIVNEKRIHSTDKILDYLDKELYKVLKREKSESRDGMDISLCRIKNICKDKKIKYEIQYSGAKLSITYYSQQKAELIKTKSTRRTIGGKPSIRIDFLKNKIILEKGDTLYFYSDGFKDQNNKTRKKLGTNKINRTILKNINSSLELQKQGLEQLLNNWQHKEEQRDDITFIGLKL